MSARGKNIQFLNTILGALQIDKPAESWGELISIIKKGMTPAVVREVHLSIAELWPDAHDLHRCMKEEKANYSGLFVGNYRFDVTASNLSRHALYNATILLVDPFPDYRQMRPEYSPVENPQKFLSTTFKYLLFWLQLAPWIEKGIVSFIRDPSDYDAALKMRIYTASQARVASDEQLRALLDAAVAEMAEQKHEEMFSLSAADNFYARKAAEMNPTFSENDFKNYIAQIRAESTQILDVGDQSQVLMHSTGTNYEMAKYICAVTESHLITDMPFRWAEMQADRKNHAVDLGQWSPFAKAFSESKVDYIENIALNDVLTLRNDGHLEEMRHFLRRVWRTCADETDNFSKEDVENLSAELGEKIREANNEWRKIDTNLLNFFAGGGVATATASIVSGNAAWLPIAIATTGGAARLLAAKRERQGFLERFPAGFFIESIRAN